jgi:hypothetical protein
LQGFFGCGLFGAFFRMAVANGDSLVADKNFGTEFGYIALG